MPARPIEILLVDDNPADIAVTRSVLATDAKKARLQVVTDGAAAIDSFDTVLPDLVLLDLNLPKRDGHEVLKALRSSETARHIPVVVVSSSSAKADVARSYAGGANSYVVKPAEFEKYRERLRALQAYWLETALIPLR